MLEKDGTSEEANPYSISALTQITTVSTTPIMGVAIALERRVLPCPMCVKLGVSREM